MGSVSVLVLTYGAFACAATAANIGVQWLALRVYGGPHALLLAMAFGTITGLIVKYILDKRWIFDDRSTGLDNHGRKFSLYALTGVGTTVIFWGTEFSFNALTPDGRFRYLGAVIGLGIGYVAKYFLDRRLAFGPAR